MKIVRAVKVCKTVMNQPSDLEGSYVEVVTDRKEGVLFGGLEPSQGSFIGLFCYHAVPWQIDKIIR